MVDGLWDRMGFHFWLFCKKAIIHETFSGGQRLEDPVPGNVSSLMLFS